MIFMESNEIGYWVIWGTSIPITTTHIGFILNNSKTFGFTKEYIISIYDKNKEKIGTEGKAREELIKNIKE